MSQKTQIITAIITITVINLGVFLYIQKVNTVSEEIQKSDKIIEENANVNVDINSQEDVIPTEVEESHNIDILYNEDGSIDTSNWKKKETDFFVIKYPKEWFWIDYDMQFGGFITNNKNLKDPWANEVGNDDVKVIISAIPLAPFSNHILDLSERLNYEMRHELQLESGGAQNKECTQNSETQFDVEYECYYSIGDVHYHLFAIGLRNEGAQSPGNYYVAAQSKNPEIIEQFFVKKRY
jgi:hypothetical protein